MVPRWARPLEVRDGSVFGPNAPTARPPPYAVYALMPTTVFGLPGIAGTEEGIGTAGAFSPTRWRFLAAARDRKRSYGVRTRFQIMRVVSGYQCQSYRGSSMVLSWS